MWVQAQLPQCSSITKSPEICPGWVCPEHIQRKCLIRSAKPPQLGPFPHERVIFSPPGYPDVPSLSPRMSLGTLQTKPFPNTDRSLGWRCVSAVRPSASPIMAETETCLFMNSSNYPLHHHHHYQLTPAGGSWFLCGCFSFCLAPLLLTWATQCRNMIHNFISISFSSAGLLASAASMATITKSFLMSVHNVLNLQGWFDWSDQIMKEVWIIWL